MNGRALRHLVQISLPPDGSSLDSRGQLSGSPTTLGTVPALIEQLSGRELSDARQQYANATHKVTFYRDSSYTVTPKCYLVFDSQTLDIVGVVPDVRNQFLTCICGERL